uniref:Rho GDP dissociation inhibitor beta n=1 Tax=Capra hircus TaxID=9925 RepID=A0A8C2N931_CAPHI
MIKMTEKAPEPHVEEDDDELDGKLNYKPPPQKSLKELQEMDKDDESLIKYKKTLLGDGPVVADPTAPNVTVTRLTLVCESAPGPITMDLTGDLEALKKETFVLKEGVEYRVKINFKWIKQHSCWPEALTTTSLSSPTTTSMTTSPGSGTCPLRRTGQNERLGPSLCLSLPPRRALGPSSLITAGPLPQHPPPS